MTQEKYQDTPQESGVAKILAVKSVNFIEVAEALANQVKNGEVNPIDMHIALKKMEKTIEKFKDDNEVKDIITREVNKWLENDKSVTFGDTKLSVAAVYTTYDFTVCKDVYYDELKKIQTTINELVKARETELKAMFGDTTRKLGIQSKTVIIERIPTLEWTEVGEDNTIYPPVKIQRDGVKTTFIK